MKNLLADNMKTAIIAVICLFACGTASGKLSDVGSSHFASLQSRHHLDVCDYQCTGSVKIDASTSWEIDIVTSVNGSLLISIGYDVSANVIVVIHQTLKIAIVIDGKTGLIGLFSLKSGGSLVVNISTGLAVYAGGNTSLTGLISGSSKIQISALVSIAVTIISQGSASVQQGATGSTGNAFNLTTLVLAIYKSSQVSITAEAFFNGRADLKNKVTADFGVWIGIFVEQVSDGDLDVSFGIIGLLAPVFDHPHAISVGFLKVLVALYSSSSVQFNGKLALALYNALSVNIAAEDNTTVFASLIASIKAVGTFYLNLDAALTAYLNGTGLISFDQSIVVIGGKNYVVSYGHTADGSWFISIKSQSDDSVDVIIAYIASSNIFVIYNRKLSIVLVFSGSLGLFAIWNIKTGEGIIVRYTTGAAIVISANTSISGSFSSGAIISGFVAIAGQIQANANFSYSILNRSTFIFATYIVTLQTAGLSAANILVSSSVSIIIKNSFSAYFQLIAAAKQSIVSAFGVLNVIYVASGGIAGAWSAQIQGFIAAIYSSSLSGKFTSSLFIQFYASISVNITVISSSSFLATLTGAVKSITSIAGSIESAISGAIKGSIGGGIAVGGGGGIAIGGGGGSGGGIQIGR